MVFADRLHGFLFLFISLEENRALDTHRRKLERPRRISCWAGYLVAKAVSRFWRASGSTDPGNGSAGFLVQLALHTARPDFWNPTHSKAPVSLHPSTDMVSLLDTGSAIVSIALLDLAITRGSWIL